MRSSPERAAGSAAARLSCRAFARALVGDGERRGAIVTVSSQMGAVGYPDRVTYCATKHAVRGLTRALALEWAPRIRVNAVAPTFIDTPLTAPMFADVPRRGHLAHSAGPSGHCRRGGQGGAVPPVRRRIAHHRARVRRRQRLDGDLTRGAR
jgi:NAD(P)-dependent dehydrogenase (short-subunit alcohol dehydrogenase family)